MSTNKDICIVCAWRATCQKMFSISGRDIKCPDFVRDATLKEEPSEDQEQVDSEKQ